MSWTAWSRPQTLCAADRPPRTDSGGPVDEPMDASPRSPAAALEGAPTRGGGDPPDELGLVMTGGGARAAYQVGFLRTLARRVPGLEIPVLTGTSAGAINAAFLASRAGSFRERVEELAALWSDLGARDVFAVGPLGLCSHVVRWGLSLVSGGLVPLRLTGLVDTRPLRTLLTRALELDGRPMAAGIDANLASGTLQAVALTTASYTTGQSVTWTQGRRIDDWERVHRLGRETRLGVEHVMASAALPLFFPAIRLEDSDPGERAGSTRTAWYGDGGMRQTAPLSPAIHLGADRILAISTRHAATAAEASEPQVTGYPPPARVAGMLLNALFLDQLDGDALRLDRINRLIAAQRPEDRQGLRPLGLLVLRPSVDLGVLANEFEPKLPWTFRWLTRGLGTKRTRGNDFLSLVMFQPDYLRALIRLGEEDAERRHDEIEEFLRG